MANQSNIFQLLYHLTVPQHESNEHDDDTAAITEILLLLKNKPSLAQKQDMHGKIPLQ